MNWLIWIGLICVTASCALAFFAWVGRTLTEWNERKALESASVVVRRPAQHDNCRCTITRPALPPADGFAQDQAALCSDWRAVGGDLRSTITKAVRNTLGSLDNGNH